MNKKTSINSNKVAWLLLCLTIRGVLGILAWNIKLL